MNRGTMSASLIAFALLAGRDAAAQKITVWGEVGVGPAFVGSAWAARVGGGIQRGRNLLVFRATNLADLANVFFAPDSIVYSHTEWSFLFGRGTVASTRQVYVAAGLGVAKISRGSGDVRRLSFPVEVAISARPLAFFGVGAALFANLNSESTFSGIVFNLQAGRLR